MGTTGVIDYKEEADWKRKGTREHLSSKSGARDAGVHRPSAISNKNGYHSMDTHV